MASSSENLLNLSNLWYIFVLAEIFIVATPWPPPSPVHSTYPVSRK